jgi:hypothetical protein
MIVGDESLAVPIWGFVGVLVGAIVSGGFSYRVEMRKFRKAREATVEERQYEAEQRRLQYQRKVLTEIDSQWLKWTKEVQEEALRASDHRSRHPDDSRLYTSPLRDRLLMLREQLDPTGDVAVALALADHEATKYAGYTRGESNDPGEQISAWVESSSSAAQRVAVALRELH